MPNRKSRSGPAVGQAHPYRLVGPCRCCGSTDEDAAGCYVLDICTPPVLLPGEAHWLCLDCSPWAARSAVFRDRVNLAAARGTTLADMSGGLPVTVDLDRGPRH